MPKYSFRVLPNAYIIMYCKTCTPDFPVYRARGELDLDTACTRANQHSVAIHSIHQYPRRKRVQT